MTGTTDGSTGTQGTASATGSAGTNGSMDSGTGTTQGTGTGAASTGAGSTGVSSTGQSGSSTGPVPMCNPVGEPNETEDDATPLGIIDDCDGSGASVMGELEGDADADWYTYSASDVFGCVVDPSRDVVSTMPLRFCKFVKCASGQVSIDSCPAGAQSATSPGGHPGCCRYGTNLANFDVAIDCPGSDDSAQIFLRIDQGTAGTCTPYTVSYHF